jgi:hypothetical protein
MSTLDSSEPTKTTVDLAELENFAQLLFKKLKADGHLTIELRHDYYWGVPGDHRYLTEEPKQLELGQLTHDLERLRQMASGETSPLALGLAWLGPLLTAIGEDIFT